MIDARYIPALDRYLVFQGGLPKLATYAQLIDCCCPDIDFICVRKTYLPADDGRYYCVKSIGWRAPDHIQSGGDTTATCGSVAIDDPLAGEGCKTYAQTQDLRHPITNAVVSVGECMLGSGGVEIAEEVYDTAHMWIIVSAHDTLSDCTDVCGTTEARVEAYECLANVDGRIADETWTDSGVQYTVESVHSTLSDCYLLCGAEEAL